MESELVKILKGKVEVTELNESNIAEFVQATRTQQTYDSLIKDPFKARVLDDGMKGIYSGEGVDLKVVEKTYPRKMSDSAVFSNLEGNLRTIEENHTAGKQMYGIRIFDDQIMVDAAHLASQLDIWRSMPIGESTQKSIRYDGKGVKPMADKYMGLLSVPSLVPDMTSLDFSDGNDVALAARHYIAWAEQNKLINKNIVTPFKKAFKGQAQTDMSRTVFDRHEYGGLLVQVTSVPRDEPNYVNMISTFSDNLKTWASQGAEDCVPGLTSYNMDLQEPRMYVSLGALKQDAASLRDDKTTKMKQEISILYLPEKATILSMDL